MHSTATTTRRGRRLTGRAVLAVGISALAACGGGGAKSTDTTAAASAGTAASEPASSTGGGAGKKGCEVVTKDDFQTAFGFAPTQVDEGPSGAGLLATCSMSGGDTSGGKVAVVIVRYGKGRASTFDSEQRAVESAVKAKGTAVSGIGDKAVKTTSSTQAWVSFTKGGDLVQLSVSGTGVGAAEAEALAKAAAGRL